MDLQSRKLHFIEELLTIDNDRVIERLENVLREEMKALNPVLKEKLTSRAQKAHEDIVAGRVFDRQGAEDELQARMG